MMKKNKMSKKIFIVYGHHNTKKSFNASIRDTFINEAKKNGASLPVTEIVDKYYEEVQKNGGNRLDTSSLMTLLDK